MRQFVIRMLNLILIVGILVIYQQYAFERAEVVAAHEAEEKRAKALQKEFDQMVAEAQGGSQSGSYKDGVFEGTGEGFAGDIVVAVTIKNKEIEKVEIVSADDEDPEYMDVANVLLDQIVEEQSTDLDTVTGATFSSTGILEAAENALEEAQ